MTNLHDLASKNPSSEAKAAIKKALKGAADDQKKITNQAKLLRQATGLQEYPTEVLEAELESRKREVQAR